MLSIRLEHSKCCTSLPPLGQLPSLKDLYIEGLIAIKHLVDEWLLANVVSKQLTSITALSISGVKKLTCIPTWFTQGLMELKNWIIKECNELVTLWENKVRLQRCLLSLQHLEISRCPKLVCLFEEEEEKEEGEGWEKKEHEGFPCMTRLEYLQIEACPMLKKLPQDLHTYTSLQELKIYSCASLVSFPKTTLPSMLRELVIINCNVLESLPEFTKLNTIRELLVLKCASPIYLSSRSRLQSSLKQLQIDECEGLKSLLTKDRIKIAHLLKL
ncbi:hypothetical protein ACSBR1_018364 [Camellia fascicularis]